MFYEMNRTATLMVCIAALTVLSCGGSRMAGGSVNLDVLRAETVDVWVTGERGPLPIYTVDDRHYLLGRDGEQYELWLANKTDHRIEVVASVDGRDVISGREADFRKDRGYVLYPGEELKIEGFRKSMSKVAAFEFSPPSESYADRMGDGSHVGVIGVAVFDEVEPLQPQPLRKIADDHYDYDNEADYPSASPAKASAYQGASEESSEPGLGTKYGDEVGSEAEIVPFVRLNSETPMELVSLFYNDREGLEAVGVVFESDPEDKPTDRCNGPNPFPGVPCETVFAPPPPR